MTADWMIPMLEKTAPAPFPRVIPFRLAAEYRGYVIYGSDEAWPRLGEGEVRRKYQLSDTLPNINKPTMLVDIDEIGPVGLFYHILVIPAVLFCCCWLTDNLANGKAGKEKRTK